MSALLVHPERLGAIAGGDVRLHQAPVTGLAKRLEDGQLLGGADRSRRIARQPVHLRQAVECPDERLSQPRALFRDPATVLSRQEGAPGDRLGRRRLGAGLLEVARRERALGRGRGLVGGDHVDPGPLGEGELVAAESAGQMLGRVEPALGEHGPELADEERERLLPRCRRHVPPERLGQLVPGNGATLRSDEIGEHEPSLTAREARLVDDGAARLDPHALRQRHPDGHLFPP